MIAKRARMVKLLLIRQYVAMIMDVKMNFSKRTLKKLWV